MSNYFIITLQKTMTTTFERTVDFVRAESWIIYDPLTYEQVDSAFSSL